MVGLRTRGRWLEKENHGVLGRCLSLKIKKHLKLNILTVIYNIVKNSDADLTVGN